MDAQARNSSKNLLAPHDLKRGIISIGSHPENDIVISDPQVLPFHLTIDHRQRPYRLFVPDPQADITIGGRRLSGEPSAEVTNLADIQFAGYTLEILENASGQDGGPLEGVLLVRVVPSQQAAPEHAPAHPETSKPPVEMEVLPKSQTINKGETAAFQLAITNAGWRVGAFEVVVEIKKKDTDKAGVKKDQPKWKVDIDIRDQFTGERESGEVTPKNDSSRPETWGFTSTARLRLNERESATVEISITPEPDSNIHPDFHIAAGDYNVTFRVESPDYDSSAEDSVTLNVEPFYGFKCDLHPLISNANWWQAATQVGINLTNQGNSTASYRLEGQDNENGLKLGFLSQEQGRAEGMTGLTDDSLLNRAITLGQERKIQKVKVAPEHAAPSPAQPDNLERADIEQVPPVKLFIRPLRRALVRLSPRQYPYSITVTSEDDESLIQPLYGVYRQAPLIGPVGILLLIAVLALTIGGLYLHVERDIKPRIAIKDFTCISSGEARPNTFTCQWKKIPEDKNIEVKITTMSDKSIARPERYTEKAEIDIFENDWLTLHTNYKVGPWVLLQETSEPFKVVYTPGKRRVKIEIENVNLVQSAKLSEVMTGEKVSVIFKIEPIGEGEDGSNPLPIEGEVSVAIGSETSNKDGEEDDRPCNAQAGSCTLTVKKIGVNKNIILSYSGSEYFEPTTSLPYKETISVIHRPVVIEPGSVEVGLLGDNGNIQPSTTLLPGQQNVAMKVNVRSDFYDYLGSEDQMNKGKVTLRIGVTTQDADLVRASPGRYTATFKNISLEGGENAYTVEYKPEDVFVGKPVKDTIQVKPVKASIDCFHHYPGREIPSDKDICAAEQEDGIHFPGMPITIRFRVKPPEGAYVTPPDSFTIWNASEETEKKINSCRSPKENKDNQWDVTCTFIPIQPFPASIKEIEQEIIPYRISIKMEGDRNFEPFEASQEIRLQPSTTKLTFVDPATDESPFQGPNSKVPFKVKVEIDERIEAALLDQNWINQAYVQFSKDDNEECSRAPLTRDASPNSFTASCSISFPKAALYTIKATFKSGNDPIQNTPKEYRAQSIKTETYLSDVKITNTSNQVTFTVTVNAVPQNGIGSKEVDSGTVTFHVVDATSGNSVQPIEAPKSLSKSGGKYTVDFLHTLNPGVYQIWAEYTDGQGNFSASSSDEKKQYTVVGSTSEFSKPNPVEVEFKDGEIEVNARIAFDKPLINGLTKWGTVEFTFDNYDFVRKFGEISCTDGNSTLVLKNGNNIGTATCRVKNNFSDPQISTTPYLINVTVKYSGIADPDEGLILLPSKSNNDPHNLAIKFK